MPESFAPIQGAGLGRSRAVVLAAVRKFDTDLDPDQEIGLRVVLPGPRPAETPSWVTGVRVQELVAACTDELEGLLRPPVSDCVSAEDGLRLVVVMQSEQVVLLAGFLESLRARVIERGLAEPLRGRRGIVVRAVVIGRSPRIAREAWTSFRASDEVAAAQDAHVFAVPSCIALLLDRPGRRLTQEELDDMSAAAVRTLVLEAQALEEQLLFEQVPYGFQRWELVEYIDEASSLESARERIELARYVESFVSHPGTANARRRVLTSERMIDAWLRKDGASVDAMMEDGERADDTISARWRASDASLCERASRAAVSIGAAAGIDSPTWAEDVGKRLRRALDIELRDEGDRAADGNLLKMQLSQPGADGVERLVDLVEIDAIHAELGECGTERLIKELEDVTRSIVRSRELLGPAPAARSVDDGAAALGALPDLRKRWIETVGPQPPASHWLAWVWVAFGALATPLLQALAADADPTGEPWTLPVVLRWAFHLTNRDAGAALFGAVVSFGCFSLLQRHIVNAWERRADALRVEIEAAVQAAAAASRRLETERHRLLVRTQSSILARADVTLHWLRRRTQAIAHTQRHASWLRERVLLNLPEEPLERAWRLRARTGAVAWSLEPPRTDVPAGGAPGPSPWTSFSKFRPHDDEGRASSFFLWPLQVREHWRNLRARQEPPDLHRTGEPLTRKALDDARGSRIDAEASAMEYYIALLGKRMAARLVGVVADDVEGAITRLAPPHVSVRTLSGGSEDRLVLLSIARDLPGPAVGSRSPSGGRVDAGPQEASGA